ncbi:MAG: hypothetical protein K940chlam9_01427 [Chlamydiae bacterium]|nr:hypothetical protein [Chlamydiota bacterium]
MNLLYSKQMDEAQEKPYYGKEIDSDQEQELIQIILSKYRLEPVTDELRKKITCELQEAKAAGKISIPYQVVMRKSPSPYHRSYIEILLDTKL